MSFDALAWAVKSQPGSAADKLVLLGLADRHNTEHNAAYPSIDWLVEFSGLDRKTVIAALSRLQTSEYISDSGQRVGKTKQVKVWHLSIPKTEQYQKRNSSVFPSKASQKRDTDTIKGTSKTSGAKAPSVSRATSMTEDWSAPMGYLEWSMEEMGWSTDQGMAELRRFKDHALAKGSKYIDWMAAWRNWCRSPYCKTKPAEELTAYRKEPLRV